MNGGRLAGPDPARHHGPAGLIDPLTLNFPPEIEGEFRDEYFSQALGHVRFAVVVGLLTHCAFGFWDGMVGGEAKQTLWLLRFGIGCPVGLLIFGLSFTRVFQRWMQLLLSLVMLAVGASLLAMLAVSPPALHASYYPGLILASIFTQTFLKLRFWYATTTTWLIIIGYQIVAINIVELPLPVLIHNDFFLVACAGVGTIVGYGIEHYTRQEFLLRFRNAALLREITEQKNAADQANLAKSKFLAAASHDLRQPMHALGLFVGTLRARAVEPELQELVERIDASVRAMDGLFNALLDISKLDAGVVTVHLDSFALAPLLDCIVNDYAPQARAKGLRFHVRPCCCWVRSDPTLLERVLRNLVANAVRHSERGGIVLGCRRRGGSVSIEVWDTGPGIPADRQRDVFDEFCQLGNPARDRNEGLGLGLAIVKRLCQLLDHPLRLASTVGRGSRFAVLVPMAQALATAPATGMGAASLARSIAGSFILVIDDEAGVRDSMRGLLGGWGCHVVCASSGADAVRQLADYDRLPDLILSDYRLRDEETGTEAIDRVRKALDHPVPAVLITGDTAPERLREAQQSGHRLLHKPVLPETLRWLVACTVGGVGPEACRLNHVAHRVCKGDCPAAIAAAGRAETASLPD